MFFGIGFALTIAWAFVYPSLLADVDSTYAGPIAGTLGAIVFIGGGHLIDRFRAKARASHEPERSSAVR